MWKEAVWTSRNDDNLTHDSWKIGRDLNRPRPKTGLQSYHCTSVLCETVPQTGGWGSNWEGNSKSFTKHDKRGGWIFGSEAEIRKEWRKLHHEKLQNLLSCLIIVTAIIIF
jgi:hypothetical protein